MNTQKIYIVTAKTGNETHLVKAYNTEAAAIKHVTNAIKWYKEWISKPFNALAPFYSIWDEKTNPWDHTTPHIINDQIIYDWQTVTLNS